MLTVKRLVFYSQNIVFHLEITGYEVYCAEVPFLLVYAGQISPAVDGEISCGSGVH